ncbi:sre G protein-coupled chemoreceptor domain-containing protein [Ditylenchus destructor]|uniref:Sre G protein-coupled chemoreceptor domain-containing protein n=1 Tax=Ditylenchus destructor TaxID=166010 RepID=A0AAD4NBU4_9BILA|nr:sre G protein-coupled chemoreceptor domain-containing protein [Ditylenchus destructor]
MSNPEPPLIPYVRISVAVKSLKETPWSTGFSALLILESSLIASATVIVIILLFLLIRTQFLHTNCSRLIANTAGHYLVLAVVPRYFEIAYTFYYNTKWNGMNILNVENGILLINDFTLPLDEKVQSPLYWPGIIRIFFAFVGAFSLPAIAVERCCAAIYVTDYERNKRSLISVLLILIVDCGSAICTYINAFEKIGGMEQVGIVAIVNVVALFVSGT